MDKLTLSTTGDKWRAEAEGNGYFAAPGIGIKTDNGVVNGFDLPGDYQEIIDAALAARNFGAAVDLGVSFDILKYLTISASVTDLGFINWTGTRLGSNQEAIEYTGVENLGEDGVDIGKQFEALGKDLLNLISPRVQAENEQLKDMLSMTTHLGLEFRIPFWQRLSVGALGTYRFDGPYSWWEARGSVNLALFRWLSFSGNHAWSTFGDSYGAALNFHPNGLNLFVGVDSFKPALNVTPQYIPIDSFNTTVAVGLNLAFGKYHCRYPKKVKN
jgi:hypothetical protein